MTLAVRRVTEHIYSERLLFSSAIVRKQTNKTCYPALANVFSEGRLLPRLVLLLNA